MLAPRPALVTREPVLWSLIGGDCDEAIGIIRARARAA
jgi:hypothetical protein